MNQNLLDHIANEPTHTRMGPLPKKKSKADIVMLKLFSAKPQPDRPTTAPAERNEDQTLRDMDELQQFENDALKRQ